MMGPSWTEQWLYWKTQTPLQTDRVAAIKELEKLLQSDVVGRVASLSLLFCFNVFLLFVAFDISEVLRFQALSEILTESFCVMK